MSAKNSPAKEAAPTPEKKVAEKVAKEGEHKSADAKDGDDSDDEDFKPEEAKDLSNPDVTTKYTTAAEIANRALKLVLSKIEVGADIAELCAIGDEEVLKGTSKVYNKKVEGNAEQKAKVASKTAGKRGAKKGSAKKDEEAKVEMEKGSAFPTCISVNEIAGNFAPLSSEAGRKIQAGDLVKVNLGAHIDGYAVEAGHTVVVGGAEEIVQDRRADVAQAAWTAAEAAVRAIKVGGTNTQVTEMIGAAAREFRCQPCAGVLSHQSTQFGCDGAEKLIIGRVVEPTEREAAADKLKGGLNSNDADLGPLNQKEKNFNPNALRQDVDECTFGLNEVYTVDILMTSNEANDGKLKELAVDAGAGEKAEKAAAKVARLEKNEGENKEAIEEAKKILAEAQKNERESCRACVYKRVPDNNFSLRTQKARQFISEVGQKMNRFPFALRQMSDEQTARVGVAEAKRHELLQEYPVMSEKSGEYVAGFKFTVLLLANGTKKITGLPSLVVEGKDMANLSANIKPAKTEIESEELKALLAQGTGKKRRNKKSKKSAGEGEEKKE